MEFVFCKHKGQSSPETISLFINGLSKTAYMYVDYTIGYGCKVDLYNSNLLMLEMPSCVYSQEECEHFFQLLQVKISKLLKSYETFNDRGTLTGYWNIELVDDLKNELNSCVSKYTYWPAHEIISGLSSGKELLESLKNNSLEEFRQKIIKKALEQYIFLDELEEFRQKIIKEALEQYIFLDELEVEEYLSEIIEYVEKKAQLIKIDIKYRPK